MFVFHWGGTMKVTQGTPIDFQMSTKAHGKSVIPFVYKKCDEDNSSYPVYLKW